MKESQNPFESGTGHLKARPESGEHMFAFFEQCAQEADSIVLERNEKGEVLAPNGHPSELKNELLCKLVRTKSFKNWFGDWERNPSKASKAVYQKTGEPRILFHSTVANIPLSEGLRPMNGRGLFFSSDSTSSYEWGGYKGKPSPDATVSVYPCFINLNGPNNARGNIIEANPPYNDIYYAVESEDQIMHIPFNLVENAPER